MIVPLCVFNLPPDYVIKCNVIGRLMVCNVYGITKWVSCYKMREKIVIKNLLKNAAGVYYKVPQVLQSVTVKKWDVTLESMSSCIDLTFTSQPSLVMEAGVHSSLHPSCHIR